MAYVNADSLVSADWVADHLDDPKVRILDGSYHLAATGRNGKAEYLEAHIPGAILIPLSTFNAAAVPDPGEKHLVFHCRSGRRCGMASEKMVEAGYTGTIKRMEGGFLAWDAEGYDKESG